MAPADERDDPMDALAAARSVVREDEDAAARMRRRIHERLFGGAQGPTTAKRVGARYRIETLLGEGGMGAVFEAYDESADHPVALKRLTRREAELEFRREFHTLVSLRHPNIVEAFDYGLDDEGAYYTMELLPGAELRALGRADVATVCAIVRDLASALAFLHARRLIHRDLSVRNVRRSPRGTFKLIDFGLLSTVGARPVPAGTAPYVAPETLRGLPLDHRADLFSLGAVAYVLLTGKHAFPARSFEEAELLHESPPPPLASFRDDVPAPLSELVLRLLSTDALARPASAAEVIDRLARIAPSRENGGDGDGEVVRAYLTSTAFVGREAEMEQFRERARAAAVGRGAALVLDGPSGIGKSRLLRELAIESKLVGATVVLVEPDAQQKPYGAVRAAIARLLEGTPDVVARASRRHGGHLAVAVPELALEAGAVDRAEWLEPTEQRLLVQRDLQELLFDVARERAVVLLVDDAQRIDESSLAVFASVAQPPAGVSLLIVAACTTDEPQRSPAALADLVRKATSVPVRGLARADVHSLVRALIGEVPNGGKLADVVYAAGGGSPLLCTEIARHLVDSGVVRYVEGLWVVPDDVALDALPKRLDDAMDARIGSLSANARRVGVATAIHGRDITLDLAVTLGAPLSESEVFAAIDELVACDVLIGDGHVFTLAHRAVRGALLRTLDDDELAAAHSRIADALAPSLQAEPTLDGEIGEHLLRAGRAREAAPLLHRAGRRLYETQSLRDAIPLLEAALSAYGDGDEDATAELRQLLIVAGAMADMSLVLRQGDAAFQAAWRRAGLDAGERVAGVLGRPLGVFSALVVAWWRGRVAREGRTRQSPMDLTRSALVLATACFAAYAHLRAFEKMEPLLEHLKLFDVFRRTVPHTAYRVSLAMYELVSGRREATCKHSDAALAALESDRLVKLSGYDRLAAEATVRNTRAWVLVVDQDPAFEVDIAAVERMELPSFGFSCAIFRAIFHRHRGEELIAHRMEERAEAIRVQLGTMWMWEASLWQQSSFAYALTRDRLGLKRCIEALTRLEAQGFNMSAYSELARANYLREHGALDEAWERLCALDAKLRSRNDVLPHVLVARGETALARGDMHEARAAAKRADELARDPNGGMRSMRLRAARVAALADAIDNPERAFAALADAIAEAESLGSPSLAGALHEAAFAVALEARDEKRLRLHEDGVFRWFRPTQTPALIARLDQITSLSQAPRSAVAGHVVESLTVTRREIA